MIPIESQALAETLLWCFLVMASVIGVVLFLDWFAKKLLSATLDSPQEQAQREADLAQERERQAKEIHRKQMRSVKYWNL